ncbi:hypothetical protein [Amycolatopsis sp. NPDC051372]|uniref:hypothetical protein n=1 Tax=Amycolatopsis sp. NPDC051372 TaxID=3155669 RepID=UPI0034477118
MQRAPADDDQLIGLVTPDRPAGKVDFMPTSDRVTAEAHATAARQAIEQGRSTADPISLATAEGLLAVFHQLKYMQDDTITLRGAADLVDAMDTLSRKLGDR